MIIIVNENIISNLKNVIDMNLLFIFNLKSNESIIDYYKLCYQILKLMSMGFWGFGVLGFVFFLFADFFFLTAVAFGHDDLLIVVKLQLRRLVGGTQLPPSTIFSGAARRRANRVGYVVKFTLLARNL